MPNSYNKYRSSVEILKRIRREFPIQKLPNNVLINELGIIGKDTIWKTIKQIFTFIYIYTHIYIKLFTNYIYIQI